MAAAVPDRLGPTCSNLDPDGRPPGERHQPGAGPSLFGAAVTSSSVWAIPSDAQVYVAGHRGLVGAAVWRHLAEQGFTNLLGRSSAELDLRHREATFAFMKEARPDVVVMAAARVGGIGANAAYPVDFLSDNLLIQIVVHLSEGFAPTHS
jgi:NAD dependent epimerase/dehydratase family